jgi:hypothetical protein
MHNHKNKLMLFLKIEEKYWYIWTCHVKNCSEIWKFVNVRKYYRQMNLKWQPINYTEKNRNCVFSSHKFICSILCSHNFTNIKVKNYIVACRPAAKLWLCKQWPLLGNGCTQDCVLYAVQVIATWSNNGGIVEGGVFCAVRAKAI